METTLKTVAGKMIIESLYHLSNLWSLKSLEPAMMTFQIQLLPPKNPQNALYMNVNRFFTEELALSLDER